MVNVSDIVIPDRPQFFGEHAGETTIDDTFLRSLRKWRKQMDTCFSKENRENASMPPSPAEHCFGRFGVIDTINRELGLELLAIRQQIDEASGRYGGKQLYTSQKAGVAWLGMQMLDGEKAYCLEGAPGTGKTLMLRAALQASINLQIRGILSGNVVCALQKPFLIQQQSFSESMRAQRIADRVTATDVNDQWNYYVFIARDPNGIYLSRESFNNLHKQHFRDYDEARTALESNVKRRGVLEAKCNIDELLHALTLLLIRNAAMIKDEDDNWTYIELPPPADDVSEDEANVYYDGDLGGAIPSEYIERGLVLARRGGEIDVALDSKQSTEQRVNNARVVLTTVSSLVHKQKGDTMKALFGNADVIIVDDQRMAASVYQEAVMAARETGGNTPLVIAASALSTTNGLGGRPQSNRYSPCLTLPEAMTADNRKYAILPDVGVDVFPGTGTLYPADTKEAIDQLVDAHFAELEIPDNVDQPQPYNCNSLVAVHPQLVHYATGQLRQGYEDRGYRATVVPFKATVSNKGKSNTYPPYSDRIFTAMVHGNGSVHDTDGNGVVVLVAPPDAIKDSLDVPNLGNLTIATRWGVNKDSLLRMFGRLQHNSLHRQNGNPRWRGYCRQGLYSNSNADVTLFNLLPHYMDIDEDAVRDVLSWAPLQVLHSWAGVEADAITDVMQTSRVPISNKALKRRKTEPGKLLATGRRRFRWTRVVEMAGGSLEPCSNEHEEEARELWGELVRMASREAIHGDVGTQKLRSRIGFVMRRDKTLPEYIRKDRANWIQQLEEVADVLLEADPVRAIEEVIQMLQEDIAAKFRPAPVPKPVKEKKDAKKKRSRKKKVLRFKDDPYEVEQTAQKDAATETGDEEGLITDWDDDYSDDGDDDYSYGSGVFEGDGLENDGDFGYDTRDLF